MMRSPLRAGLALACVLSLSACGGGDGDYYIGGSVTGVTKSGLVLQLNGADDLAVDAAGSFYFDKRIATDKTYKVTVKSIPANVEKIEDCSVLNGTGKAIYTVSNVYVNCTIRKHALGGSIIGLDGASGLALVNGSDRIAVPQADLAAGKFSMAPVSEDSPYGVAILTQPAGRTCSVENGSGKMAQADVASIVVRCTQ